MIYPYLPLRYVVWELWGAREVGSGMLGSEVGFLAVAFACPNYPGHFGNIISYAPSGKFSKTFKHSYLALVDGASTPDPRLTNDMSNTDHLCQIRNEYQKFLIKRHHRHWVHFFF